jgi:Fur family ferric uptake transcriptional regulator
VTRYEHLFGHEHHDHLICLNCGKYIEVVEPAIEELQAKLAQKNNFQVLRHRMELYGVCQDCRRSQE